MANPFLNPIFLSKAIKSYLFDVNRMWRMPPHKLKRFQDKVFKQVVKYAYTVPLYNEKYIESRIHPDDIKGIDDIKKFPFVSKNDIRSAFPDGVIQKNVNKDRLWRINTSGATGKPLSLYRDAFGLFMDNIAGIRVLKFFCGINWRKDRITAMGPYFTPGRFDHARRQAIDDNLNLFFSLDHQFLTYIYKDLKEKIEKINKFRPDFIMGCPGDLQVMASLKKEGYGRDIRPKTIGTSGGMLDRYARRYIEDAFQCKIVDIYGSVEMGTGAVQCEEGNYHVFSDFVFLEFIDDSGDLVSSGEPGRVAVTRFFGKGTPFIRYTGTDDIATPIYEKCPCGLNTPIIKYIEGRRTECILLPDGEYITPNVFTGNVYVAMHRLKTDKIVQYQIVQESLHKIVILVVIDENQRDTPPSVDILFEEIKKEYHKVFGEAIEIKVKEVKKTIGSDDPSKPPPVIVSKINTDKNQP